MPCNSSMRISFVRATHWPLHTCWTEPNLDSRHHFRTTGTVLDMKVRFAVAPGGLAFDVPRFVELVEQLEARGFDTLWLSDIPMGPSIDPVVGLGYAAAASKRLKLGANVVPFG